MVAGCRPLLLMIALEEYNMRETVSALEWSTVTTLHGQRRLIGRDIVGDEFARLELASQTSEEIDAFKAKFQSIYDRYACPDAEQ